MLYADARNNTRRFFRADCNFVFQFGRVEFAWFCIKSQVADIYMLKLICKVKPISHRNKGAVFGWRRRVNAAKEEQ